MWAAVTVLAIVALALVAVWWWRRRLQEERVLAPRGPYPIVLVHGFLGFDSLEIFGRRLDYFRGVVEELRAHGAEVHVVRLPPLASVPERAAVLAGHVDGLDAERVNIVAHSMGGIDARYAIAALGISERVASLITIGTPHRGTPLAELGRLGAARAVRAVFERLGVSAGATDCLTPEQMDTFNRSVIDVPDVYYGSIVGRPRINKPPLPLRPGGILLQRAGTSDGVVPSASQAWGEVIAEIDADHWAQIGWSTSYDVRPVYRSILTHLRDRGL
jgi:triacylglycerol lipase